MDMIDRYIYAVIKRLPEKSKKDVESELRANINDMLPDSFTEDDVSKALYELGNPADLAAEYMDRKRYLISPALYGSYLYVLRLVAIIAGAATLIAILISVVTDPQLTQASDLVLQLFTRTLTALFQAAFQVFAWVTIIFAIMDRAGKEHLKWPFTGKSWSLKDLEPVPKSNVGIKKAEPVFSIIFTAIFTAAFCSFPEYIGLYSMNDGALSITPLFNSDIFRIYIPFILLTATLSIVLSVLKLIYQSWNIRLAIVNTIFNIVNVVVVCSFLLNSAIISADFKSAFMQFVGSSAQELTNIWYWGIRVVLIITILAGAWDSSDGFRKARRHS